MISKELEEWQPELKNPFPNLSLFLLGDMKFTYDSGAQTKIGRFVLEFGKGDITDFNDRYPFTRDVVERFYDLYYSGQPAEKTAILDDLQRMDQDAEGLKL